MSESRRPIDIAESLRATRRSRGDGTLEGRARIATPWEGKGRGMPGALISGDAPIGETIAVQRGQQWLDETGTPFSFTGFHPVLVGAGFDDVQLPLQEFVIPVTAYWRLDVKFRWQDYVGPTRVEVVLNGQVAHSESVPWADRFMGTFDCGVLLVGDTVQVRGRPRA